LFDAPSISRFIRGGAPLKLMEHAEKQNENVFPKTGAPRNKTKQQRGRDDPDAGI